jgi:hypothetical protein
VKTAATLLLTTVCKTYSAFYKFDNKLENPKALNTQYHSDNVKDNTMDNQQETKRLIII